MQLDLGVPQVVSGVATEPRQSPSENQYVTSYTVSYSMTGTDGDWVEIPGTFTGNERAVATDIKKNLFAIPILARYVRIHPKTAVNWISMRADVLLPVKSDPDFANVPEDKRTYSSTYYDEAPGAGHARSTLFSEQAWSPKTDAVDNEWMQLDLGEPQTVGGVATQPRDNGQYVTSYTVSYSMTGTDGDWDDIPGTFTGNETSKATDIKKNAFAPVWARYVRIHPKSFVSWISMRADVLLAAPSTKITCNFINLL